MGNLSNLFSNSLQCSRIAQLMSGLAQRHRRFLASAVLGAWVFALFVGIANACGWDGVTSVSHNPIVLAHSVDDAAGHESTSGCDEFCSNDIPLFSVLKLVQDQPAGQPLALDSRYNVGVLPISAPALRPAQTAHPPPGVPFLLRTVRLTL
jgi:hypothetical protein